MKLWGPNKGFGRQPERIIERRKETLRIKKVKITLAEPKGVNRGRRKDRGGTTGETTS
jgi:hypothetical protein